MADYYFDIIGGNNANSGLTPALAKKDGNGAGGGTAYAAFQAGHNVWYARGTVIVPRSGDWYHWGNQSAINTHAGQTLGSYDAGYGDALPIFDTLVYDDGPTGWSFGSGVWTKDFAAFPEIDSFSGRGWAGMLTPGTVPDRASVLRPQSSAVACVAERDFYVHPTGGTKIVTICTGGSTVDPYTHFGGLAFTRNIGAANLYDTNFCIMDMNGETVRDIAIQGCGIACITAVRNAKFIDLVIRPGRDTGIKLQGATNTCENVQIIRPHIDYMTSSYEDTVASNTYFASTDAIYASKIQGQNTGYTSNLEIVDFYIRGARHVGISASCAATGNVNAVRGITLRGTTPGAAVTTHYDVNNGRGIGIGAAGFMIDGVHVLGDPTVQGITGSGVIKRCLFQGQRYPSLLCTNNFNYGALSIAYRGNGESAAVLSTLSIDIHSNVFDQMEPYPIEVFDHPTNAAKINVGEVRIWNNVFNENPAFYNARKGGFNGEYSFPSGSVLVWCFTYTIPANKPVLPTFWNNVFIYPSGATAAYVWNNAETGTNYGGGTNPYKYVTLSINDPAAPTSPYGEVPFANKQFVSLAAAGLSADFLPSTASGLYRAGTHVRPSSDASGKQRWNPPSVGAYEG